MKISIAIVSLLASISLSSIAMATVWTWTDTVKNKYEFNGGAHTTYSFLYDLRGSGDPLNVLTDASNPFHPGPSLDHISSADLLLNFSFGRGNSTSTGTIKLDNILTQPGLFTIVDKDFDLQATALAQLNLDGTLLLNMTRSSGSFALTDSVLTAHGIDNTPIIPPGHGDDYTPSAAPVPEPGTLALLGLGVFATGIYTKRRQYKKAA